MMSRKINTFLIFALCGAICLFLGTSSVLGQEKTTLTFNQEDLETHIKERSQELEKINKEIQAAQSELQRTQSTKKTLQKELQSLEYTANQLKLNIRADEVALEKLGYEINSLDLDIGNTEISIREKKKAVSEIFRKLQKSDDENVLMLLLNNNTLADSFLELQALNDLGVQLSVDVKNLSSLKTQLADHLTVLGEKHYTTNLHQKNLTTRKSLIEEEKSERKDLIQETASKEKLYQEKIDELEKKQEEISKVITQFEEQLRLSFDASLLPSKRPGVLANPVANKTITQEYGNTDFAARAYKTKFHNGVDFGTSVGTPVFAADDGIVSAIDNNDNGTLQWQKYQYGKYILIKHTNNLSTLYAHLSRQLVSVGSEVKRGDLIGYSGNTGYSTGPHLHFTVYWAPSVTLKSIAPAAGLVPVGVTIDPLPYL